MELEKSQKKSNDESIFHQTNILIIAIYDLSTN